MNAQNPFGMEAAPDGDYVLLSDVLAALTLPDDEAGKVLEGVTQGRVVQFHPHYCAEAKGAAVSDWDTSHDLSVIRPDGTRYRIGSMRHADDAAFFQWCHANLPVLLAQRAAAAAIRELKAQRDEALNQLDSAQHSVDVLEKRVATFMSRVEAAEAKLAEVEKERDTAREWLGAANNEFGSATWNWPDLWRRIAELKELSNERWQRLTTAEAKLAEVERERDAFRDALAKHSGENIATHYTLKATVATLTAQVEAMRDQLRLIELLGYREGEQLGWLVAHMRGVANDALEGRTSNHMWRLFPNHRPAALTTKEPTNDMG